MKASQDFITVEDSDLSIVPAGDSGADGLSVAEAVDAALALLRDAGSRAAGDSAVWGFQEASDIAGRVEEASRHIEHLQIAAAGAVDRTRKQAAAAAAKANTSWTTGWRDDSSNGTTPTTADPASGVAAGWRDDSSYGTPGGVADAGAAQAVPSGDAAGWRDDSSFGTPAAVPPRGAVVAGVAGAAAAAAAAVVDDGYRNTTEFLRARLRVSGPEARRRLALAGELLPRQGFTGEVLPAVRGELGAAVASGEVGSRAATIITLALDRVRHVCAPEAVDGMEYALTRVAAENDQDFLARVARKWVDALDQDGAEPSEELLRQLQGAFIRKPRHGLHHLEIFATADQAEQLLTVMNTGTNPRTSTGAGTATDAAAPGPAAAETTPAHPGTGSVGAASAWPASSADASAKDGGAGPGVPLDLRTRPQRLLDGLVGACKVALAAGGLPATGGLRPQVMVTIDYQDLLARLNTVDMSTAGNTGTMLFTGPVTASTARKIACDADIIPVLLGGNGRILDIGRTSRIFPPHIRKALTARDQGCAFPSCTIPATWCEAHHITYWSRGGTTGTDNGVLLCSHHHHLIHKEQWTIQLHTGIPWFIPPPHIDPHQEPRRNHYFHPDHHDTAA
ncbi:DUF222 domain-containing protein [Pseudarthrobacter sp. 1C304]|uniref:DUF222 domain-containing protein n=1 Tax=Pseudarthrobacter sp. 1C304 TaxID=3457438 RepID=UPI003FD59E47